MGALAPSSLQLWPCGGGNLTSEEGILLRLLTWKDKPSWGRGKGIRNGTFAGVPAVPATGADTAPLLAGAVRVFVTRVLCGTEAVKTIHGAFARLYCNIGAWVSLACAH